MAKKTKRAGSRVKRVPKRAKPAPKRAKPAPKHAPATRLSDVTELYGSQRPLTIAGEPSILVFRASKPDHWHFVSDGIRETFEDPTTGSELTFRIPRKPREKTPPEWATNFFRKVAAHFLFSSSGFHDGHHLEITGAVDGLPYAIGVRDPELRPPGGVEFVQLVGVTADELEAVMDWDCRKFGELLGQKNPTLLTERGRPSVLTDPAFGAEIAAATARDGSSLDSVFAPHLSWTKAAGRLRITISNDARASLRRMLRGRSLHQRPFVVGSSADDTQLFVDPAATPSVKVVDGEPHVRLDAKLAETMYADLGDERTVYTWSAVELTLT